MPSTTRFDKEKPKLDYTYMKKCDHSNNYEQISWQKTQSNLTKEIYLNIYIFP